MRITIINQFYPPDISPTGRLAESLAAHRAGLGDDVTVISGQGYVAHRIWESEPSKSGVQVRRVWTSKLGKASILRRCFDYILFFAMATWRVVRLPQQDLIICLTTPPLIVAAGVIHKCLHPQTHVILWNMDCYPEMAERAGVIRKGGLISRILQALNQWLSKRIDHVVCLDDAMKSRLLARMDANQNYVPISVIHNWEASPSTRARVTRLNAQRPYEGDFVILYTGNMGHGHCFQTIIEAAKRLDDENANVRFVITGGGIGSKRLAEQLLRHRRLRNVSLWGYVTTERLHNLRASAGCALITLKDEMLGVMSPSKLHASLATGLPIVYIGPSGSNVDEAIVKFGCGVSLRQGDVDGLVEFVHRLRADRSVRASYSARACIAFKSAYCHQQALPKFDQVIESVCGKDNDHAVYCRAA